MSELIHEDETDSLLDGTCRLPFSAGIQTLVLIAWHSSLQQIEGDPELINAGHIEQEDGVEVAVEGHTELLREVVDVVVEVQPKQLDQSVLEARLVLDEEGIKIGALFSHGLMEFLESVCLVLDEAAKVAETIYFLKIFTLVITLLQFVCNVN